MASVANRLAAPTIAHASRRCQRGLAKIGAAKIDLASQAIPTPGNKGKSSDLNVILRGELGASPDCIEECR
jgi:hypothetical protein